MTHQNLTASIVICHLFSLHQCYNLLRYFLTSELQPSYKVENKHAKAQGLL